MTDAAYDFIIVGGGSAGCVLANRLSEDRDTTVALVEAGGEHDRFLLNMPLGYGKTMYSPAYSWLVRSEPEPAANGRTFYHPRGRVLGGSSAINGLLYVRGQHRDYDDWAEAGATGWGWDDVRDFFIRAEDQCRGQSQYHGTGGPLRVEDLRDSHPIEEALIVAGTNIGIPLNDDFNGTTQEGIGCYQATMKDGRRWSCANAYLDPARARDNLTVLTGACAEHVVFEEKRAAAVVVRQGREARALRAKREVILSAGAFQSPQLLQLSGIGPGRLLSGLGIDVLADSPEVGSNLHDHTGVPMAWRLRNRRDSLNRKLRFPLIVLEALRYFLSRRGVMAMPAAAVGIFTDSSGQGGRPDLQYHCLAVTGDVEAENENAQMAIDKLPGLTMMPYPTRPKSRGSVTIGSPDPTELPKITMNCLSDPYDVQVLLRGMRLAQTIAETDPLAAHVDSRVLPDGGDDSDDVYIDAMRRYSHTGYHPVGSCRMGSDETSVVDCDLKVRGVDRLRVVDGSVMPSITSGNTNAPIVMIAEKISDAIRAEYR